MDDATLSRLRNERIGFVFQAFNLIPRTTAVENVELPMCYGPASPVRSQAMAMLDRVGMAQRAEHFPSQLSGGEQQRVAIARALMLSPSLLIADEPTGNLDPQLALEIMNLFKRFNEVGVTVVIATHDVHLIEHFGARRIVLSDGRVT